MHSDHHAFVVCAVSFSQRLASLCRQLQYEFTGTCKRKGLELVEEKP